MKAESKKGTLRVDGQGQVLANREPKTPSQRSSVLIPPLSFRLHPTPRFVDWLLLTLVLFEVAGGFGSFLIGRPDAQWYFVLHGAAGLALVLLLFWKLRRVSRRLIEVRRWDSRTTASIAALASVFLALSTGMVWTTWLKPLGYPNGLNLHVAFGILLGVFVLAHLATRFKPLRPRDVAGRRAVLAGLAVAATGGALWWGREAVADAAQTPGAARRFTGSRATGSGLGLAFPITMWMFDNPALLDLSIWRLQVAGQVDKPFALRYGDFGSIPPVAVRATLDCTGGWYTEQVWRGIPVAWLLDQAQPKSNAIAVSFVSTTGYRWSIPLEEVRSLILATHVGDDALDHGHGAPLRLVAAGRRGFQWVKWITEVRVLDRQDYGQWAAIFLR